MKSKILVLTTIILLVGTLSVGALVYHINDASESLKEEYKNEVETHHSEKELKITNDVSHFTQQEITRMQSETRDYLNSRLGDDYQKALNDKTDEIYKVTNEKIEEIKRYIDGLFEENKE